MIPTHVWPPTQKFANLFPDPCLYTVHVCHTLIPDECFTARCIVFVTWIIKHAHAFKSESLIFKVSPTERKTFGGKSLSIKEGTIDSFYILIL